MSNFIDEVIKNAKQQIKYSNTITTGEITKDNGDGTYSVKIANASSAVPEMGTLNYEDNFRIGEIVTVGFEFGCKESPKIFGHAKKIKQIPKAVEVDYSGETGGGAETVESTLFCTSASGGATANDDESNYNKCHDSINGADLSYFDIYTDGVFIDQAYVDTTYAIERGYLIFNTSGIPAGAIISSAILHLYCIYKDTITDFNIVIQDGQPDYPHSPLVNSDYLYSNYKNNGGQKLVSAFTLNAYNTITLNSNGIAWINKGGLTKFCLRSSNDIARIAPVGVGGAIGIVLSEAFYGSSDYAKLVITYTI